MKRGNRSAEFSTQTFSMDRCFLMFEHIYMYIDGGIERKRNTSLKWKVRFVVKWEKLLW